MDHPHDRASSAFDPDAPARLHPDVALRDERFGALAYHYGTRRLVFVKSRALVDVLRDLDAHPSPRAAVAAHLGDDDQAQYLAALGGLYRSGVVDAR